MVFGDIATLPALTLSQVVPMVASAARGNREFLSSSRLLGILDNGILLV